MSKTDVASSLSSEVLGIVNATAAKGLGSTLICLIAAFFPSLLFHRLFDLLFEDLDNPLASSCCPSSAKDIAKRSCKTAGACLTVV